MIKRILTILLILNSITTTQAFESCVATSDTAITDIKVKDATIINVYPLVTIYNDKKTIIIEPLKTGETQVCVLKDNNKIVEFNVKVTDENTIVEKTKGIEILTIDEPETPFELDEPPMEVNSNG